MHICKIKQINDMQQRRSIFANMTQVVKIFLIINGGMLLLGFLLKNFAHIDFARVVGMYYFKSELFKPYQIITHMFMHGGFMHLLFNMYALWMFGQILEKVWGPKRFFIYYIITGLGAAILHTLVQYIHIQIATSNISPELLDIVLSEGPEAIKNGKNFINPEMANLNELLHFSNYGITVGASGAVFGILLAFGMLFPNAELMLFFIPVPIKAKYFVIGYGVLELVNGVANVPGDNIAHFAHLGGMLFGFIMIKLWKKDTPRYNM